MDESTSAVDQSLDNYIGDGAGEPTPNVESATTDQTTVDAPETTEKSANPQDPEADLGVQSIPKPRFDEVLSERNELRERLQGIEELQAKVAQYEQIMQNPRFQQVLQEPAVQDPVREQAIAKLKEFGVATKDEIASIREEIRQEFQSDIARRDWEKDVDTQAAELSRKYDGSDGQPKFDVETIADYIRKTGGVRREDGGLDLEKTHVLMNLDAFVDAKAKAKKSSAFTEKSGQVATLPTENSEWKAAKAEAQRSGNFDSLLDRFVPEKYR